MYPISLKGAHMHCEDHPGKTTEGNVREGTGKEKRFKEKIAD